MDLNLDITWRLKVHEKILGNANIDFNSTFESQYIGIFATTTNVNPRNVVGYLTQITNISLLGGITEISDRLIIPNQIPKLLVFPLELDFYKLRFRFADPVGNCVVKIWEGTVI